MVCSKFYFEALLDLARDDDTLAVAFEVTLCCESAFLSAFLPFEIPRRLADPFVLYTLKASGDAHFFRICLRREEGLDV